MITLFKKKKCSTTIGLQVSENNLSLLVLDNNDESNPIVIDYVNHIVNASHPLDKVQKIVKQYSVENNLADASCCLVLDDEDYQLLTIEAPPVPEDEMIEAVKWKVKDLLQFPLSEAVIDVFLQENSQVSGKYIANVVVAQKQLIEKKKQYVDRLGLRLNAIDIPEMAYRNYIDSSSHNGKNIALVRIKKNSGKLIVMKNSSVYFSRSFPVSYNAGLFDDLPETEIVLELQRSLDYYERQLKHVTPTDIVFFGESITEDKITAITKSSFNQNIIVEDEMIKDTMSYQFSDEESLLSSSIITSYGAALRCDLLAGGRV